MTQMPLPRFLMLIVAVIVAGGVTVFIAAQAGVPWALMGGIALSAAGLVRMLARVE